MAGRQASRRHQRAHAFRLKVKASPAARLSCRQGSALMPGSCGAFVETRASSVSALQHGHVFKSPIASKLNAGVPAQSVQFVMVSTADGSEMWTPWRLQHGLIPWRKHIRWSRQCLHRQAARHLDMYLSMRMRRRNGGRCVLLSSLRDCCWYSRLHHVGGYLIFPSSA